MLVDAVAGQNFWEHLQIFASGSFFIGFVGHIVQTFPTPENKYAQWFLGSIQYLVGQRVRALNTIAGEGTLTKQVPRDTQNPPARSTRLHRSIKGRATESKCRLCNPSRFANTPRGLTSARRAMDVCEHSALRNSTRGIWTA
jgi:hypothetical protein